VSALYSQAPETRLCLLRTQGVIKSPCHPPLVPHCHPPENWSRAVVLQGCTAARMGEKRQEPRLWFVCSPANMPILIGRLIALPFIRCHAGADSVLLVGTRLATLVCLQQMALAISAATGIASINRRAPGQQSLDLCRSAVVLQAIQSRDRCCSDHHCCGNCMYHHGSCC